MSAKIPLIKRIALDERTGCWNWKGAKRRDGYGETWFAGKQRVATRVSAHLWLGMSLEDPRWVLHRCDNPSCFNPKHLYLGNGTDNQNDRLLRGRNATRNRTHCPKGHPYAGSNLLFGEEGRHRRCRTCVYAQNKRSAAKMKAIRSGI